MKLRAGKNLDKPAPFLGPENGTESSRKTEDTHGIIFYASYLAGGRLYFDKLVLQELLSSAVGAVSRISRVTAARNVSEKYHASVSKMSFFRRQISTPGAYI